MRFGGVCVHLFRSFVSFLVVCVCVHPLPFHCLSFYLLLFCWSVDLLLLLLRVCFRLCVCASQPMEDGIQGFMARVAAPGVTEVRITGKYNLLVC